MSNSLKLHGLQHTRLPCPSPAPGACSNSCLLSQWWHATISSSVIPLSSCLQSFPATGSFLRSQLFASGGQCIGASASASVLPMIFQDWVPLGLTGLISLKSKGISSSPTPQFKIINSSPFIVVFIWSSSAFFMVQHSHPCMITGKASDGKTTALTRWTFVGKVMSLLSICSLGVP